MPAEGSQHHEPLMNTTSVALSGLVMSRPLSSPNCIEKNWNGVRWPSGDWKNAIGAPFCLQSFGSGFKPSVELSVMLFSAASHSWIVKLSSTKEVQGSVLWNIEASSPSFTPPPSESATSQSVQDMFSSQF